MNMKRIQIAVLIGMTAVLSTWAEGNRVAQKDLALLQGEWSMVSGTADGEPLPAEMVKQMKRVCKGDEITSTRGGRRFFKAKVTLDSSKTPKTIDYDMTEGFTKGQKQLGIYEVDGDALKSCFAAPGADRPTEFVSKPGDQRTLTVWKREKPSTTPQERK
jgi:uncharacterized protein (TIGR03067 family)